MTVSLIIPIYNAASCLHRCLDSVLAQTYTDFECLLIDDGSSDDSLQICRNYQCRDTRFRVVHQENRGVAEARNTGIQHASADYLCWLDADDALLPDYLHDLVSDIRRADTPDLVIQGFTRIEFGKKVVALPSPASGQYFFSKDRDKFFSEVNIRDFGVSFSKLFRRDLIINYVITYSPRIRVAEDLDFLLRYLSVCQSIFVSTQCNYCYYILPDTLSHKIFSFEQELKGLYHLDHSWQIISSALGYSLSMQQQRDTCLADYTHRTVIANYRKRQKRATRLTNLRSLPVKYLTLYRKHFHPTLFLRIISHLVGSRHFFWADTLLSIRLQ